MIRDQYSMNFRLPIKVFRCIYQYITLVVLKYFMIARFICQGEKKKDYQ